MIIDCVSWLGIEQNVEKKWGNHPYKSVCVFFFLQPATIFCKKEIALTGVFGLRLLTGHTPSCRRDNFAQKFVYLPFPCSHMKNGHQCRPSSNPLMIREKCASNSLLHVWNATFIVWHVTENSGTFKTQSFYLSFIM